MTKKEYILAVIDAMPDWKMGWWIKTMVQNDQLEEPTLDKLVIIFKKAMDNLDEVIKKNKMIESIKAMESLEKDKEEQAKEDEQNLAQLDDLLNNI